MEDFAARLEIGEVLKSERLNATIKGCLLFRELDRIEEEYSYWEEWELSHHSLSDVWVEYDHDDKRVALYEPLTLPEPPDPRTLAQGERVPLRLPDGSTRTAHVRESGFGELVGVKGRPSCRVSRGDRIAYATLEFIDEHGVRKTVNIEVYNQEDYSVHMKRILSRDEQVNFFGKRISPAGDPSAANALLFVIVAFFLLLFIAFALSRAEDDSGGDGGGGGGGIVYHHHRSVYGGGGGGVGK